MADSIKKIETDHFDMIDLLNCDNVPCDEIRDDVQKFLHELYPLGEDDIDEDKAAGDNKYVITTTETYDYAEPIIDIHHFHVNLPDDDKARELADLLDGRIESGLSNEKTFRFTYRMELCIKAQTQEEAEAKFEFLDLNDVHAKYVETCSIEEQ